MTKGIRAHAIQVFASNLPALNAGEFSPKTFRAEVMNLLIVTHAISVASAATHYNHALKLAKAATPELVAGLGRAEDKKGGRKPVHVVTVIKAKSGEIVAENISKAKAELLITRAAEQKKPKLIIKPDAVAETPAAEGGEAAPAAGATETAGETAAA